MKRVEKWIEVRLHSSGLGLLFLYLYSGPKANHNAENNLENDTTWFILNKQAAFVERVAICDEPEESPLGPIKVTLTSSNIDGIIDWIVFGD